MARALTPASALLRSGDAPLFDFRLRPVDEIQPWGSPPDLTLSWFGLTDGFYRMQVGAERLFSFSEKAREKFAAEFPGFSCDYVDYQVVRLWEDVLQLLPAALAPLPPLLCEMMSGPEPQVLTTLDRAYQSWKTLDAGASPAEDDRYYDAVLWLSQRNLDAMYLQSGPRIWIWSTNDTVTITWDNRGQDIDGVPMWSTERGCYSLPRAAFLDEVSSFNDRLMDEMAHRVDEVCQRRNRPEIHIDLEELKREQIERSLALGQALARPPEPENWNRVLNAIDYYSKI